MRTGRLAVEQGGAGDDGRLGGAVGVPDLAAVDREARGELGRAGLAAEDQQAHVLERLGRPERGERRHGRDDGDAARGQPRAEVDAAAHERARRGNEAGAVAPGEPHLLARGVERDGEAGEHAVARAERLVAQEEARLGVDERGGGAVA